jgi:hypothetical protein
MFHMDTLDDPYEEDLIRLVKLNDLIDHVRGLNPDDPAKWMELIAAVGAMREILEHIVLDIKHHRID